MKQKIQKHKHEAPEKLDLFRDTFRGKMPLTDDYVFHAVFGRDTAASPSKIRSRPRNGKWKKAQSWTSKRKPTQENY